MNWEEEICRRVDEICAQKTELERLHKIEELVDCIEDLLLTAYVKGKQNAKRSE